MSGTLPLLSSEQLADAAFHLLTSSSLDRYARMARGAATRSGLAQRVAAQPSLIPALLGRGRELLRELRRLSTRDVPEVELAMVLSTLAHTAEPAVGRLLRDIGVDDRPSLAWLAALARSLLKEVTHNQVERLAPLLPGEASVGTTFSSGTGPSSTFGSWLHCSNARSAHREVLVA